MKRSSSRDKERGFALLLTLVIVLIAGVMLVSLAQQSTTEAVRAAEATEALQRRWAIISMRETLLPRASRVLNRVNAERFTDEGPIVEFDHISEPIVHHWVSCELSGSAYDLVFTDEQAKLNPTALERLIERRGMIDVLKQALENGGVEGADRLRLRPAITTDELAIRPIENTSRQNTPNEDQPFEISYGHFGQIFDELGPDRLLGDRQQPGPALMVTCWTDGKLNLTRARREAVRSLYEPWVGLEGCRELLERRDALSDADLAQWLGIAASEQSPAENSVSIGLASSLSATRSTAQGLWIVAHGETRRWHTFSVRVFSPPIDTTDDEESEPLQPLAAVTQSSSQRTSLTESADHTSGRHSETDRSIEDPWAQPYVRYDYAW